MHARYHVQTTRETLWRHFEVHALAEIVSANLEQDSIVSLLGKQTHRHYCDRETARSQEYVEQEHRLIAELATQDGEAQEQRRALGRLLHTVQDFYAHSNYVQLWLRANGGMAHVMPEEMDPLDGDVLAHPDFLVGEWSPWRDMMYHIPVIGGLARHMWLPVDSHEAINLDSPKRGPLFYYAMASAKRRTVLEYERAVAAIRLAGGRAAIERFHAVESSR